MTSYILIVIIDIYYYISIIVCHAPAFRRRRHNIFGLSGRPSVRPKPDIPSFHLNMGPLVHPTKRDRFAACPSVRLSGEVSRHLPKRMEGMAWHVACWCILVNFRTDYIMVTVCWFFLFWHYFDLVKRVKFVVSGRFLENATREWPEILHADLPWPPPELIRLWPRAIDFSHFCAILT